MRPSAIRRLHGIAWLSLAIASANLGFIVIMGSSPLVQSDSWHFLDTFIRRYLDGSLGLDAFFAVRPFGDHGQPILRLILLLHTHFFSLDFKVEALIGWLFAVAGAFFLLIVVAKSMDHRTHTAPPAFAIAGLLSVFLSLNNPEVFTWSLVTLGYVPILGSLLLSYSAWCLHREDKGAVWAILAAIFAAAATDQFAVLTVIAIALSLLIEAPRQWARAARTVAIVAIPVLLLTLLPKVLIPVASSHVALSSMRDTVLSLATSGKAWDALVLVPLSSSIVHAWQMSNLHESTVSTLKTTLGFMLLLAHAAFWWSQLSRRFGHNAGTFLASVLMLLFYASIAGVLLNRVPMYGFEYFAQPRYVLFYQLSVVALLLQLVAAPIKEPTGGAVRCAGQEERRPLLRSASLVCVGLLVLGVEVWLSLNSWAHVKYVSQYDQRAAFQLGRLQRNPDVVPAGCASILAVCSMPPDKRRDLMNLLHGHGLNVFSRRFQMVYRIYPDEESIPRPHD